MSDRPARVTALRTCPRNVWRAGQTRGRTGGGARTGSHAQSASMSSGSAPLGGARGLTSSSNGSPGPLSYRSCQ